MRSARRSLRLIRHKILPIADEICLLAARFGTCEKPEADIPGASCVHDVYAGIPAS